MRKILLIDFDGVINICANTVDFEDLAEKTGWQWQGVAWKDLNKTPFLWPNTPDFFEPDIRFSNELARDIREMNSGGDVEIFWASAWNERTKELNEVFEFTPGLPWLNTEGASPTAIRGDWFSEKVHSAFRELQEDFLKEGEPLRLVWVDDDFLEFPKIKEHLLKVLEKELPEGSEIHLVGTDIGKGITKEQWVEIRSLLEARVK